MDLSQLPKMGETPKPPPPMADASPPTTTIVYRDAPGGFGPVAVWISLVIGLLFLMFGANFGRWAMEKLQGREMVTGWPNDDGSPRTYFQLTGGTAWSEAGYFVMGVALLIDAALLFFVYRSATPKRGLLTVALAATGLALAINLGAAGYVFSLGILPISSVVAVLVGGMMLFEQLGLWRTTR